VGRTVLLVANDGCPGFPITKANICETARKKKEHAMFLKTTHGLMPYLYQEKKALARKISKSLWNKRGTNGV
jgi:hypothetical protein